MSRPPHKLRRDRLVEAGRCSAILCLRFGYALARGGAQHAPAGITVRQGGNQHVLNFLMVFDTGPDLNECEMIDRTVCGFGVRFAPFGTMLSSYGCGDIA